MRTTPERATPPDANWLELRLIGTTTNRNAIGAQVRITLPNGQTLTRQVECGTGQGNANSPTLHFGLGPTTTPLTATILWPSDPTHPQLVPNLSPNRIITIQQPTTPN